MDVVLGMGYRDTPHIKNAYKRFGNTMYVDHWFKAECFAPPMIGIAKDEGKVIDKSLKVSKSGKPMWWLPVVQLEFRPMERLNMNKALGILLVTSPHTRIPKDFTPKTPKEVEVLARRKSNRDWRIEIIEAFISFVYQRQGKNKWVLIEIGKGYA